MPKERRVNSSSVDRAMVSPYSCSSKKSSQSSPGSSLPVGDEKEWEEARCPICMEHPHNAVLLCCSSQKKGCRPFICDTSSQLSNCLKQFQKSAALSAQNPATELQMGLTCPLCRGVITGFHVIQPARRFMDSKTRSCSLENCNFTGNYDELRAHARLQHPFERPSEANPTQQLNWEVLVQREFEEQLVHHSDFENDLVNGWLTWDEVMREDDFWYDGTFSDFPSGMLDIENALADEICVSPFLPIFGLESPAFMEALLNSVSSPSRDRFPWTSTSNSDSGNPFLSLLGLDSPAFPEVVINSGSSHGRDRFPWTRTSNSGSRPTNHVRNSMPRSRPRSSFSGANGLGSGYQRQNDAVNLRSRPHYRRGNNSGISTPRARYRRENTAARSSNQREYVWRRSWTWHCEGETGGHY